MMEEGSLFVPKGSTARFAENSRQGLQLPVKSAVVVGGGPGGLAAAIKIAEMGVKVTIVEARDANYQRPHQLNARQCTLEGFQEYGVYESVQQASGWGDAVQSPQRKGLHGESVRTIQSDSVVQVRISDVEKALYQRTQALGIKYLAHHEVHLGEPDERGMYPVSLQPVSQVHGQFLKIGPAESIGIPDMIVVCDGAGSPTRSRLGIEFVEESQAHTYLGGQVNLPLDDPGGFVKQIVQEGQELRHFMATGHKKYPQTWVSIEADASVRQMTPEQRTELLAKRASQVMGKAVSPDDIVWGNGQVTMVQNRRAARTVAGNNVVLLGDSARTGSVWQSGGLNLALTSDVHNLMLLVEGINDRGQSREHALRVYDLKAQMASRAWHRAGENELKPASS